jgi:hypothetical protein
MGMLYLSTFFGNSVRPTAFELHFLGITSQAIFDGLFINHHTIAQQ